MSLIKKISTPSQSNPKRTPREQKRQISITGLSIIILDVVLIFCGFLAPAQTTSAMQKIEEYKEKGRQIIIRTAVLDMQDSFEETRDNFDLTAYDISVWENSQELKILFKMPSIIFLPINTSFYGNLAGELVSHHFSMEILANPSNFDGSIGFYPQYPEFEILEQIDFVIDAINEAHGQGSFNKEAFVGRMEIRKQASFYDINIRSGALVSYLKVEKSTGKVFDERHRQVKLPPQVEDKFVEIKN